MGILVWAAFALLIGVYICGPIVDPDLWWHINIGRWIYAKAEIPNIDYWTEYGAGLPWRAYSWSNELILAVADLHYGETGLAVLKLALGILLAFSLCFVFSRLASDWFFGALLGAFATCASFNHFTLRPQSLTWIFFAWVIYFTERSVRRGGPGRAEALGLVVFFSLWANTHITTALGIFMVALWSFDRERLDLPIKLCALAFLGTLITPYLGGEWLTFFSKTGHPFAHRVIAEFQPATIMQYSTGFLLIAFVLVLAFLHVQPLAVAPAKLLAALAFLGAGLAVVKFLPMGTIALCAVIALQWREGASKLGNLEEGIEKLRALVGRVPKEGLTFLLLCLAFVQGWKFWQEKLSETVNPVEALDFFIEKDLPLPLLNDFGKGGYVSYRLSDKNGVPSYRVPIDGRTNVTPPEVFDEYLAAFDGKENWADYFNRVSPKTVLWRTDSALVAILYATEDWCELIRTGDESFGYALFIKREIYESSFAELDSVNCAPEAEADKPEEAEASEANPV